MQTNTHPAIGRAMQSVAAAAPRAAADPTRPVYHFCPPAYWMNDPNGVIYHDGVYHLFYQHNPYGDAWGHIHWGHARSADLVHWEHLPIALWPSEELGEGHCYSGCATVNGEGQPMLFYTSVSPGEREERGANAQWAAVGDADWLTWQKHPQNPILALDTHGGPHFAGDWRDPFIFTEAGRTFMVLGATLDDQAVVALYEATDEALVHWRYGGVLYARPRAERRFLECPNFFKLDDKWLLITSPFDRLEYVVGSFDVESLTFTPEQRGILDHGASEVPHFYASNILFDAMGRCILLGWVRGFAAGRGWNGCLSLPRVLTLGPDGHPRQTPLPALQSLRGHHVAVQDVSLNDDSLLLDGAPGDTMEMRVRFAWGDAAAVGLRVRRSADGRRGVPIRVANGQLHVAQNIAPLSYVSAGDHGKHIELHIFLDRAVLELFVDDGHTCVTHVIDSRVKDCGVELFAEGGTAHIVSCEAWEMQPIWNDPAE